MQPPSLAIALLRASDKEKYGLPFFFFYFVPYRAGRSGPDCDAECKVRGAIGWIECGWSNCSDLDRENILSTDVRVTHLWSLSLPR